LIKGPQGGNWQPSKKIPSSPHAMNEGEKKNKLRKREGKKETKRQAITKGVCFLITRKKRKKGEKKKTQKKQEKTNSLQNQAKGEAH